MAIGRLQEGVYYDANRDMFYTEKERYERELYRQKEDEYRRQQALMQNPSYNPAQQQAMIGQGFVNTAPKPDLKDPLAFLQNTDKKLLLTGEMQ
jgi:hypothetical protein